MRATHTFTGPFGVIDGYILDVQYHNVALCDSGSCCARDNGNKWYIVEGQLDDEARTSITAGSAPFSGSYYPEGNLGSFDGKTTDGDWTLEVTDNKRNRTGTSRNWSIMFETN